MALGKHKVEIGNSGLDRYVRRNENFVLVALVVEAASGRHLPWRGKPAATGDIKGEALG